MRKLILFLAPSLLFGQGGVVQNGGGSVTGYPPTLNVIVDRPVAFNATLTPTGTTNVADVTCFGGVTYLSGSVDLSKGPATLPLSLKVTQLGPFTAGCKVTFGIVGGSDFPALTAQSTGIAVAPTNDLTSAEAKGHPISTATGELYDNLPPDLSLGGPLPLEFRRYYASELRANGLTTRIGNNWMHNFEWILSFNGTQATVTRFKARPIVFQLIGNNWQLVNAEQYGYQLVSIGSSTYQFLDPRTNLIYVFTGTASTLGLSSIQDRNSNTISVSAPLNSQSQVTDNLGRSLTISYDTNGNLFRVTDQGGRIVSFGYNQSGDLSQVTDANGKVEFYNYTVADNFPGQVTARTLPLGNKPFSQTWDALARVATQTDSRGNVTAFTYDSPQGTTSYADPLGVVVSDTSRNYSDFVSYTDVDKQTASVTYDNNQRRLSVTDRLGDKSSRTYHAASGYVATETDAAGNVTTYTWTAQTQGPLTFYVLTNIQYADGSSLAIGYDNLGNRTSVTDQAGKVWKYVYNSRGQVTSVTDPAGRVTSYSYNTSDATLFSVTDGAGNVTQYAHDTLKRVAQIKFADGSSRSFVYDNRDNVVKTVDERAKTSTFTFNDNNEFSGSTDALSKTSAITYDGDEHLSKVTGRNGQSTAYTYDPTGFPQQVTWPAGDVFTFGHDKHNRLSSIADASGKGLSFAYDKEDVLASVTDALSRKTTFATDKLGYTTQVISPLGETYAQTRDKLERVTALTDPTNVATNFNYDPRGPVSRIAVGTSVVSLTRDDGNLLTGIADPNGSLWSFKYDSAGRLQSRADPLGRTTTYTFDKRNRVASFQNGVGGAALTYDLNGNEIQRVYSDGTTLSYAFDDDNRSLGGTGAVITRDADGQITGSNGLTITRDADERIASIAYAPSKLVTYHYNSLGLLDSITDWQNGVTNFTYDSSRALIGVRRPNGRSTQIVYDGDGRVLSITEDNGASATVQRDAAGRKISETRSLPASFNLAPGTLSLAFDAAQQVSSSTYDAMGRLTADSLRTYQWNLASQLTGFTGADGSASATYDVFGLRLSRPTPAGPVNYVWNYATELPSLATVRNGTGDQRYYIYLPDGTLLYGIDATGARHFYHFDDTGSTTMLTDDSGATTDTYAYSPYGETVAHSGSTENPFTWQGQSGVMQENANGLYYMRERYYDSASARFLSPDPVLSVHPLEVNPYEYARSNPIGFGDATGLMPVQYVRIADSLSGFVLPHTYEPNLRTYLNLNSGPEPKIDYIAALHQAELMQRGQASNTSTTPKSFAYRDSLDPYTGPFGARYVPTTEELRNEQINTLVQIHIVQSLRSAPPKFLDKSFITPFALPGVMRSPSLDDTVRDFISITPQLSKN